MLHVYEMLTQFKQMGCVKHKYILHLFVAKIGAKSGSQIDCIIQMTSTLENGKN